MNVVLALIVMIMQRVQTCLEVITAHAKRDLLGTIHIVKVPEIIKPLSNIINHLYKQVTMSKYIFLIITYFN